MCAPDPNAGIRQQAKIEKQKKDAAYHSASLKFWNREAAAKQRIGGLTKGLSRTKSDAYSRAIWALGKGRLQQQKIYRSGFAKLSRVSDKTGESRARRYMSGKYRDLLDKQRQIESSLDATFGRNMDTLWQGMKRNHMNKVVKNREKIGIRPEYGAPVMMPPRDSAGQMMANISMGLQIASIGVGLSDIKLKENIEQVGTSPSGYKIYEWNYKSAPNSRYRGVIAQDVVKINPMAVTIQADNMLGVYYNRIDVTMEKVS